MALDLITSHMDVIKSTINGRYIGACFLMLLMLKNRS